MRPFLEPQIKTLALLQLLLLASLALNAAWISWDLLSPGLPRTETSTSTQARMSAAVSSSAKKTAAEMLMINGTFCGKDEDLELVKHLRNIVLIINTNSDKQAATAGRFMRALYSRFFDTVVVIGPRDIPEYGVEGKKHNPLKSQWHAAYTYLPVVMARHRDAEGFLWVEDAVVLNYWTLGATNKSRLWLPGPSASCKNCQTFVPFQEELYEDHNDGWSAEIPVRRQTMRALGHCDVPYIQRHKKSILPRRDGYYKQLVEVFYIPRRFADQAAFELIPIFREEGIKSQIAIPNIFFLLDQPANYDPVLQTMETRWEEGPNAAGLRHWNKTMSAYRPWVLKPIELREHSLRLLAQGDPCLEKFLPLLNDQTMFPP